MFKIILSLLVCFSGLSSLASAESRNCTAEEKNAANAQLLQIDSDPNIQATLTLRHAPVGLPVSAGTTANERTLFQNGYILRHDGDLRTALWVSYQMTDRDIAGAEGKDRVNCFRMDPRLKREEAASTSDYNEPVFDQGHMTNDADLKDDVIEQINTYVMSNMSPQHCRFNRGIWLSLEHLTRIWAEQYKSLYVTSGAIFDRDGSPGRDEDSQADRMQSRNGKTRVAIPSHYYKTFLRYDGNSWQVISFLLLHNNEDHGIEWSEVLPTIRADIVSLEDVERHAGIRLYPNLERSEIIQSQDGAGWDLSRGKANFGASCN